MSEDVHWSVLRICNDLTAQHMLLPVTTYLPTVISFRYVIGEGGKGNASGGRSVL